MNIAVIGSGFVGQATGRGLAKHNHEVTFVDIDNVKLESLKSDGYRALHADELNINHDLIILTLPTPTVKDKIVLDYIKSAANKIGRLLRDSKEYTTIVVRSTVPPGTTRKQIIPIIEMMSGKKANEDFGIAMQPEFLRQVSANEDFERPWHIVIGADSQKTAELLEKIYLPFNAPIERMSIEEAEMQKYVHNLYNAVKIAYFNEMRTICAKEGWDADKIFQSAAQSCEGIWNPVYGIRDYGPFDGACLPKDTAALLEWGHRKGYSLEVLGAVISQNRNYARKYKKRTDTKANKSQFKHVTVGA